MNQATQTTADENGRWDCLAKEIANGFQARKWTDARSTCSCYGHEGATHLWILTGSDGYEQQPRSQMEVEIIQERLEAKGLAEEMGFGVSDDGYTWVMLIERTHFKTSHKKWNDRLTLLLWDAWQEAGNALKS